MAHSIQLHDWSLTPQEAVQLQHRLRQAVLTTPLNRPIETIAGCDISFDKFSPILHAGIVVLRLPSLEVVEKSGVEMETQFPYIPGLLSFREMPPLLEAWAKLKTEPDAVMLDGQGIAHPRRFGIAAHFGLVVDRPAFGCAKSVLVGTFETPVPERGNWTPLLHKGETVGAAVQTKNEVNPVYVSPGHKIDLAGAIQLALQCDGGYRVPEPTRRAHLLVNQLRLDAQQAPSQSLF